MNGGWTTWVSEPPVSGEEQGVDLELGPQIEFDAGTTEARLPGRHGYFCLSSPLLLLVPHLSCKFRRQNRRGCDFDVPFAA